MELLMLHRIFAEGVVSVGNFGLPHSRADASFWKVHAGIGSGFVDEGWPFGQPSVSHAP